MIGAEKDLNFILEYEKTIEHGKAFTSTNRKYIWDLKLFSINGSTKYLRDWSPNLQGDNSSLSLGNLILFSLPKVENKLSFI